MKIDGDYATRVETLDYLKQPENDIKDQENMTSKVTHESNPYEEEVPDDICTRMIICIFGSCAKCSCCKNVVDRIFGNEKEDDSFLS